jgi:hypothetical protein
MKQLAVLTLAAVLISSIASAQSISASAAKLAENTAVQSTPRRDSVLEGALIGGAIGLGATLILAKRACGTLSGNSECAEIWVPGGLSLFVPAGIVTGALIDRAVGKSRVMVAPVIANGGAALTGTIRLGQK